MMKMISISVLLSVIAVLIALILRNVFKTELYVSDLSGISIFVTAFGTLYGIMSAFIIIEVWNQYNKTVTVINLEANGLERLSRLTVYFRDSELLKKMTEALRKYINTVVGDKFAALSNGKRNQDSAKSFREISKVIREIKFDDNHDEIIFSEVVKHFGLLSETRAERLDISLARLPFLLKFFSYFCSVAMITTFLFMPFLNVWYLGAVLFTLTFIISMMHQLIEDLDNPFVGTWNISTEPFERALSHIESDYK